jgi:urea transporter
MTLTRRRLIAALLSAAAAVPIVRLLPARAAGLEEGFYMLNGWILTAADVAALGLEDEARRLG